MTDHLVGVKEVAEMAGVTTQAVWFWQKMAHHNFPQPEVVLAMGPVWKRHVIEKWLEQRESDTTQYTVKMRRKRR